MKLLKPRQEKTDSYIKKLVEKSKLRHIAFIIDGNRRWSKINKKSYEIGYLMGSNKLKNCIVNYKNYGIKYITVYAFSISNLKRPKKEIDTLMEIFISQLRNVLPDLIKIGVVFKFIGNLLDIPENFRKFFLSIGEKTQNNNGIYLQIAFNYTSREEITNAVKNIVNKVMSNEIYKDNISEELITKELYTKNTPDPDLVIRTSGEKRISNFLLWQISFSELIFFEENCPILEERI